MSTMNLGVWLVGAALVASACTQVGPEPDAAPRASPPVSSPIPSPMPPPSPTPPPSPSPEPDPPDREPARLIAWVAAEDEARVVKVELRSRAVVARFDVCAGPHNLVAISSRRAVVACPPAGAIALLRGGSARIVPLGGRPHDVKMAGDLVVVTNEREARLDLVSLAGSVEGRIALKANPHDVAVGPRGNVAWVTLNGSDDIAVVDLRKRSVRYISTGRRPHDILFAPNGKVWVTDWGGAVHVFGSQTEELVASFPLGVEAHHLAFTPDGAEAWLTDHGAHRVFVIDAKRFAVLEELPIHGAPHHVAITPDGRWAVVADHDNGTLVVYGVKTRRQVVEIRVGTGPHGVWTAPER